MANLWSMTNDPELLGLVEHCNLCGRKLHPDRTSWVEVDIEGTVLSIDNVAVATSEADSQGCFPVGRECVKKIRRG